MRKCPSIILLIFILVTITTKSSLAQYYNFPYVGWNQSFSSGYWNGFTIVRGFGSTTITQDTIIEGRKYFISGKSGDPIRNENGKLYRYGYWTSGVLSDKLEYDFTLNINDVFPPNIYIHNTPLKVITKERIINMVGDSVWRMELANESQDTFTWIEGIGDLKFGLITNVGFESSIIHMCTYDDKNRKLGINNISIFTYDCDYIHGTDIDNDGYVNFMKEKIQIPFTILPFNFLSNYIVRTCDSIKINSSFIKIHTDLNCKGTLVQESNSPFYIIKDISTYDRLFLSKNCVDFAVLRVIPCRYDDCNDNNANINPHMQEVTYNGVDDDCNSGTLDDDLDMDGYLYADDCNDLDSNIFPGAIDLPDNNIDEDCDGKDNITNSINESNRNISVKIIPNPTDQKIQISGGSPNLNIVSIKLYNILGEELMSSIQNQSKNEYDISFIPKGIFFCQINFSDDSSVIRSLIKI